ncbi:MAG TPA: serine/threonine-protein kinase [Trebonia sp.]|nr:serine/threonine-protein kinase [Trebonia sp.]
MSRTPASEVTPPDLPGYRFIKNIGAGGNAQVYLYEQDLPHRKVAVKVLNDSALSDTARRRFTAEANVTADLAHRHIVQVFDANVTPDGRPYIVMPYYPQPNLSVRARRSHFSVADVLRTGIQIGSAVETSHRRDVLHRDIKPQNILTDSYGEPALTDFGIATTKGGDGPEGLSVPWSPPEVIFGISPGDQRADVYSLGATLWHLLVGRSPFEQPGGDNSTFALMGRIKSEPPPRTQRADVPDSLERLLRQAMAKDPGGRPQSAMELIRGLQSIEQELRLPLTHPILPAEEPSGDTRGGDTIARPRARAENMFFGRPASGLTDMPPARGATEAAAWGPGAGYADPRTHGSQAVRGQSQRGQTQGGYGTAQPGQQPWGQTTPPWATGADPRTHGAPAAWSGGTYDATVTRGARPAGPDGDQTRTRGPMRVEPWGQAGPVDDDRTRTRGPVRLDPRGGSVQGTEFPEFQLGGREGTTTARPAALPPDSRAAAGTGGTRPSGRVLALAGGVLVAVVAVVAFFTLGQGNGQPGQNPAPTAQATASSGAQDALGPGATAPGQPTVTAHQADGTQVRFSWKYANPVAGDTFRWQRVSGSAGTAGGVTTKPEVLISLSQGQNVCIAVQVRRAGGQASEQSQPVCWP